MPNTWRPNRDENGWKKRKNNSEPIEEYGPHLLFVEEVTRLTTDVIALMELTSHPKPPEVPVRPTDKQAIFLMGYASRPCFG